MPQELASVATINSFVSLGYCKMALSVGLMWRILVVGVSPWNEKHGMKLR